MKEGAIIKVAFPQSDGQIKFRPAVLIKIVPPFNDLLVCAISTQVQHFISGLDIMLKKEDDDFAQTRLKQNSLIRVAKLVTIPSAEAEGEIGNISNQRYRLLLEQLKNFL